ncbi:MAG: hypothetical protein ACR2PS_03075 [Pseudomonadales bacterium]
MVKKVTIRIKQTKVEADYEGFIGTQCELLDQRIQPDNLVEVENEPKPEVNFNPTLTESEALNQ